MTDAEEVWTRYQGGDGGSSCTETGSLPSVGGTVWPRGAFVARVLLLLLDGHPLGVLCETHGVIRSPMETME